MNAFYNEPVVIGVDTGNKMMKTANTVFHSGLKKLDGPPPIQPKDPLDVIRFENTYYMVSTERLDYSRDKTQTNDYFILTLIGIAKELQHRNIHPHGAHIVLSMGLPPGHLKENMVERYQAYFRRNDGRYRFECSGTAYQVVIDRVFVNPQGLACLFVDKQDLLQKNDIMIIDIGGYTVDVIHMVNGNPDAEQITSLDHGTIPFYRRVINNMNSRFDRKITEQQIDYLLMKNGDTDSKCYFSTEHVNFIKESAAEHVKNLFGHLKELGMDVRSTFVVFSGGGSILLHEELKHQVPSVGDYIVIKDIAANAKGYEVFARARMSRGG